RDALRCRRGEEKPRIELVHLSVQESDAENARGKAADRRDLDLVGWEAQVAALRDKEKSAVFGEAGFSRHRRVEAGYTRRGEYRADNFMFFRRSVCLSCGDAGLDSFLRRPGNLLFEVCRLQALRKDVLAEHHLARFVLRLRGEDPAHHAAPAV